MISMHRKTLRLNVSYLKNAWVVTIFDGEHSENRSFRTETEAREFGATRLEQLRSRHDPIRLGLKA